MGRPRVHMFRNPKAGADSLLIDEYAARQRNVQTKLAQEAAMVYVRARAIRAQHRDTGLSRIGRSTGRIDHHVTLNDPRGAAHGIEHTTAILRRSIGARKVGRRAGRLRARGYNRRRL